MDSLTVKIYNLFALFIIFNLFFSFAPAIGFPYMINDIHGDSMSPTIPDRSIVLVEEYDNHYIEENDIIVYENNYKNKYVMHRVIETKSDGSYILQGDNNLYKDSYEPTQKDIKYIYTTHIPPYLYLSALGVYIIMIMYDVSRKLFK